MATIFRYGSRDSLPLKLDTVSGIDRLMVTNVDENGDLVSSGGGGGGTEYTEGATPPANTVGAAILFNDSGTWAEVTESNGLPVNVVATVGGGGGSGTEYTEGVDTVAGGEGTLVLADNGSGVGASLNLSGGDLLVTLDGETVAISAASLPLPSGASTSALQSTANGLLTAIEADTSTLAAVDFATETTLGLVQSALDLATASTGATGSDTKVGFTMVGRRQDASGPPTGVADGDNMQPIFGAAGGLKTEVEVSALPTGAATSAAQATAQSSLTAIATSLAIMDDWDLSDRCRVSPIVGQSGVAAGSGASGTTTQRVILATNDPAVTSLAIIDDWDETDRCKVNPISGQAGVAGGSGTVGATTQRVVLATDVALPAGTNNIGDVDVASTPGSAVNTLPGIVDATTLSSDSTWTKLVTNGSSDACFMVCIQNRSDDWIEIAYNDSPTDTSGTDIDDYLGPGGVLVLDLKSNQRYVDTDIEVRRFDGTPTLGYVSATMYY